MINSSLLLGSGANIANMSVEEFAFIKHLTMLQNAKTSWSTFENYVLGILKKAIEELQKNANVFKFDDTTEDAYTAYLLAHFNSDAMFGLSYTHDGNSRGHADMTVQYSNFTWHGEAKKHSSYDYLLDGYLQLTERYTTGDSNNQSGAIIIYVKNKDTLKVMNNWKKHLISNKGKTVIFSSSNGKQLILDSTHKHSASGLKFKTIHFPVILYYKPIV
ncbi:MULTISPECIES: hypothetical protein [unclassified Pantoea]|uniref:hypothetical protein n=1 Tax=unclassified Pantoea TaxID=2630326 RepID=UPI001CD79542|nr:MULTISPECIES: hypothetical protein [unclassified Pantoea]MCA1178612.1 hypothetical protein [Pantoea sp. alder69]MCA1252030.1 hypothetical protein [Pantoea sp. alder70]MCA1267101.1 hypothetical protein [Pantoea sp. alder81]